MLPLLIIKELWYNDSTISRKSQDFMGGGFCSKREHDNLFLQKKMKRWGGEIGRRTSLRS